MTTLSDVVAIFSIPGYPRFTLANCVREAQTYVFTPLAASLYNDYLVQPFITSSEDQGSNYGMYPCRTPQNTIKRKQIRYYDQIVVKHKTTHAKVTVIRIASAHQILASTSPPMYLNGLPFMSLPPPAAVTQFAPPPYLAPPSYVVTSPPPSTPPHTTTVHPPVPPPAPKKIKRLVASSFAAPPGDLSLFAAKQILELAQLKKEMCPIIAEEYATGHAAVMPCGHIFAQLSIEESFKKENGKCPACRKLGRPTFV